MFATPEIFMQAEMDYRRERMQRHLEGTRFRGAKRGRRFTVRRPRNPFKRPRDIQVAAGGTVVSA